MTERAGFCRTGLFIIMPDVGCIYSEQTWTNVTVAGEDEVEAGVSDLQKCTLKSLLTSVVVILNVLLFIQMYSALTVLGSLYCAGVSVKLCPCVFSQALSFIHWCLCITRTSKCLVPGTGDIFSAKVETRAEPGINFQDGGRRKEKGIIDIKTSD